MYMKAVHSIKKDKCKPRNTDCSVMDNLPQNPNKDSKSREQAKKKVHHQHRNHDKTQQKEKRENASSPSEKKSTRLKNKAEAFFKEFTIINSKKNAENMDNVRKTKKHRSRSSENLNQSPKVKPEHLRREKTIHVEKIRKTPENKSEPHSIKLVRERKHDEKQTRKHKHRSSSEKPNQIEVGHTNKHVMYCQVETGNPFQRVVAKDPFSSISPPKIRKEKILKDVKESNIFIEDVSRSHDTKKDNFSTELPNAHIHHKKNRPKLVVGRKPFKYSILEPNSSSEHRKHKKHHKIEISSHNIETKKRKKKSSVENNSKNIPSATPPQFHDKIEDDLKSYFTRIQSLIDKKIDALLQNYKSKIKLKSEEDILKHTPKGDISVDMYHHHHRSKSRKKISHKSPKKDSEAKQKRNVDRVEEIYHSTVERHHESARTPTRHSSSPGRKYETILDYNSHVWKNRDELQHCPAPPKNRDTSPQHSLPITESREIPRQCSLAAKKDRNLRCQDSREGRNLSTPRRHNSPVDRKYETTQHRSSSAKYYESREPHYPPAIGDYHTSELPTNNDGSLGKNYRTFPQHNSTIGAVPHYQISTNDVEDNKKHRTTKPLPNYSSASIVRMKETVKRKRLNKYTDREESKVNCTSHTEKYEHRRKTKPHKENSFRVEGIEPAKLLESGSKPSKKRVSGNLECKTVSIIGIPSRIKESSFENVEATEESIERKKRTKRFKLYYQYSRADNCFSADSGNSSEGKSVISDSLRVISDDSEIHFESCKIKKGIKKRSSSPRKSDPSNKPQKPPTQANEFSKLSTDRNIVYRETGKQRHKSSVDSKLNNIIEEKTSMSSSGERKKFNFKIDCKYFRALHSSSSDYGVRSKNKSDLLFHNDEMHVKGKKEHGNSVKFGEDNCEFSKRTRKKGPAKDYIRKMRNNKKYKEQKQKFISNSDVNISYNSLIETIKSSTEISSIEKPSSRECSNTIKGKRSNKWSTNLGNIKPQNDIQKHSNCTINNEQKVGVKEYQEKLQQLNFVTDSHLPLSYSTKETFDEVGLQQFLFDSTTRFSEISGKCMNKNKIEEHTSDLLRKIYYLIENQNRGRSVEVKSKETDLKEEKEVQVITNMQDEEISTKDLQPCCSKCQYRRSSEEAEVINKNKLAMKDITIQKTCGCDVGTEVDSNNIGAKETYVSTSSLRNQETVTRENDTNAISIEMHESNTKQNPKCVSTFKIQKVDTAMEVSTTDQASEVPEEHLQKTEDAIGDANLKPAKVQKEKEKSSLNQLSKQSDELRSKLVSQRKGREKTELKKESSTVYKEARHDHIHGKPATAKSRTTENREGLCENQNSSCDSKSTVKSKIPTSKKHAALTTAVEKKSQNKEKLCAEVCDHFLGFSKLKKSKSEISFRDKHIDADESKITSLVCLHKYCNAIKYETSSKSNTHSLDHYPNSEQPESGRLFLTKDYRTSDISSYKRRKIYDDAIRKKMKKKAGLQSKSNLAPQVFEVRFVTVDNLHHSTLVKDSNTIDKNDLFKTSFQNTLSRKPECLCDSNIHKSLFEGSFSNKNNFVKDNVTKSKLCEFYQHIIDRHGSCLSYERSNIFVNEGKACNFQRDSEQGLSGKNFVCFVDYLSKHLISNKLSGSFSEIDESFKKMQSMCNQISSNADHQQSKITFSPENDKTATPVDDFKKENCIIDKTDEDEDREIVDDTEDSFDRKFMVSCNSSCPILRAPDSSFDYLYQMDSNDTLSNMGTFVSTMKPVNTILGFALNRNASQKSFKAPILNSVVEFDFEAPCSEESGYSSTRSKNSSSITNFFKLPKIAALIKPQNDNWHCSEEKIHSKEFNSSIPPFTDYHKMTKQCQDFAQKVTEFAKSKMTEDETYEEIPLQVLLGKNKFPNIMKFKSDSSILEKKLKPERKESVQSEPIDALRSIERCVQVNFVHHPDFHPYNSSFQSGDYIQNKDRISVLYKNLADSDNCQLRDNGFEEENLKDNQVMKNNLIGSVELMKTDSQTDVELLKKILDSEIVVSSTNLSTCCITIIKSQNLKNERDDSKNILSANNVAGDTSKLFENWNGRNKGPSNSNLLDYASSRKLNNMISKKFFENLLEVYEKEIAVCSALLQDEYFLENELLHFYNGEQLNKIWKKSTVKNKIKFFIRKVFSSKARAHSEHIFPTYKMRQVESKLTPVDADCQQKLQTLARGAYKYFSMFVKAVEHNHEMIDEMKICGLLKLLERIEKGHFKFLRSEDSVDFEEEIKVQVKQAFNNIHCIAFKEAEKKHRKLSVTDMKLIATFVCKYRIGLLSRTDIIASYIGQGLFRTEQQLKGAVIFLMKQSVIDIQEFHTYCEKYLFDTNSVKNY